jgi:hypothetical protein
MKLLSISIHYMEVVLHYYNHQYSIIDYYNNELFHYYQ